MVKFAEAEKRRGGEGGDRRFAPVPMLEKPKQSRAAFEVLKAHILRERRRKKEKLEQTEEEKRARKERENRKKQHAMTLEETREQLQKDKQKLEQLKAQQSDILQQLKAVLNEKKHREEQEQQQQQQQQAQQHQQQANYVKESELIPSHHYSHGTPMPIVSYPQVVFPPGRSANIQTLYKVGVPTSQSLANVIPSGSLKHSRTPSPPPSASHNYVPCLVKNLHPSHTSVVPVSLPTTKSGSSTNVYLSSQPQYYHGSNPQSHNPPGQYSQTSTSQGAAVVAPYLTTPSGPPPLTNSQPPVPSQPTREDKHLQPVYLTNSRGPSAHSSLHPSHDHKKQSAGGGSFGPAADSGTDKYYVRPHLVLHPGSVLPPVQQPPSSYNAHSASINRSYF